MRAAIVVAVACLSAVGLCAGQDVKASIRQPTNIPAQDLASALKTLAYERGFQLMVWADVLGTKHTQGAVGDLTTTEALTRLLEGTNLVFSYLNDKTVTILPVNSNNKLDGQGPLTGNSQHCPGLSSNKLDYTTSQDETASGSAVTNWIGSEDLLGCAQIYSKENQRLVSAFAGADTEPVQNNDQNVKLDEILVTAQKREERLQEVPVPVAVLSAEALTQSDQLRLQDYYSKVPGLNLTVGGAAGDPIISIRGIQNGQGGSPSVGVVIDDVPYGSSVGLGVRGQPNIDPGDLARVEVLRGPQGTLYGASSIGGLLKFVTVDPSTDELSGRVQAGTSSFFNGVDPGYNFRGSVNVPSSETMAVRASAFREQDPGYIENIQTGQQGINRRTSDGGRVALSWKPSDVLSLKLSALVQDSKRDGGEQATLGLGFGDLQQRALPHTGSFDEKTQAYSATLNMKFGDVELTSLTGYNVDHFTSVLDLTRVFGGFYTDCGGTPSKFCGLASFYLGSPGAVALYSAGTRKFSEELRLSIPITDRMNWMLGGFYTYEKNDLSVSDNGADLATGTPTSADFLGVETNLKYVEYAAFTNLAYNFTDRFDTQFGGRLSKNKQTFDTVRSGPAAPLFYPDPTISNFPSSGTSVTYLVTPRFKLSSDVMVYARFASGYRPGGANVACGAGIPCEFGAEKTENYDLGLKAEVLEHVLTLDASVYYISYKDIQITVTDSGGVFSGQANLGKAKSRGIELSAEARPVRGLLISGWVAWNDAEFTGGLPEIAGAAAPQPGDRLPYSSRFSGAFSVDEDFHVKGSLDAFVGGTVNYVGRRVGVVQAPGTPQAMLPGYAQADLHAGLKYNTWTLTAFVNNITNKRGILEGGSDYQYIYPDPNTYTYIQPRIYGLNASKTF